MENKNNSTNNDQIILTDQNGNRYIVNGDGKLEALPNEPKQQTWAEKHSKLFTGLICAGFTGLGALVTGLLMSKNETDNDTLYLDSGDVSDN